MKLYRLVKQNFPTNLIAVPGDCIILSVFEFLEQKALDGTVIQEHCFQVSYFQPVPQGNNNLECH